MEIGRALADPADDTETTERAASMFGLPTDLAQGLAEERIIPVYPANWTALQAMLAMATQWRIGMSGATGLDYSALREVMDMLEIEGRPDTFRAVQIIERAMLAVWRETSER